VKVSPERTSFTQYGATTLTPEVLKVTPPVVTRLWKATPFSGVRTIMACVDEGSSVSRIITPPLAHGFVSCSVTTRATIVPSPLRG
jgi:hypothetical protein